MTTKANTVGMPPIIPVDAETRDMLAYAESPAGRARIEQAREEIRQGKGIAMTPEYFSELNRRIAKRVAGKRSRT